MLKNVTIKKKLCEEKIILIIIFNKICFNLKKIKTFKLWKSILVVKKSKKVKKLWKSNKKLWKSQYCCEKS